MSQIALPLTIAPGVATIVTGPSLDPVVAALRATPSWPFRTAILYGPPRSGKSLLAQWFVASGAGDAIDDADRVAEDTVFHRWNRAQGEGRALLLVCARAPGTWRIALPDLASRLGAALPIEIGAPDDALLRALIEVHAARRGLGLSESVRDWLAARIERSHAACESLVALIDRLSLERKAPVTLALARDALARQAGGVGLSGIGDGQWQPRLL